jgi:hypothetical protein
MIQKLRSKRQERQVGEVIDASVTDRIIGIKDHPGSHGLSPSRSATATPFPSSLGKRFRAIAMTGRFEDKGENTRMPKGQSMRNSPRFDRRKTIMRLGPVFAAP